MNHVYTYSNCWEDYPNIKIFDITFIHHFVNAFSNLLAARDIKLNSLYNLCNSQGCELWACFKTIFLNHRLKYNKLYVFRESYVSIFCVDLFLEVIMPHHCSFIFLPFHITRVRFVTVINFLFFLIQIGFS